MSISKRLLLLVFFIVLPLTVSARDFSRMFPASELQRANGVYSPNIQGMLFEDIARYLSGDELATLQRVQLLQPWRRTEDPFEFSANSATGEMLVPTFSLKFFDELAIATAWFERFGCNKESVFDYVAAMDYSNLDLPNPLAAPNVPDQAYKLDNFVDEVSQKTLKSALAVILLHELGHTPSRHRQYGQINANHALAQETESGRFALTVRRRRCPPRAPGFPR